MDRACREGGHEVFRDLAGKWNYSGDPSDGGGWGRQDVSGKFRRGSTGGGGSLEGGEADFPDGKRIFTDEWEETGATFCRGGE